MTSPAPVAGSAIPPFPVLHQDGNFLILRKPAGVHVHPSPLSPGEPSMLKPVQDWTGCQVFPLHRLDRPASGPLAFGLDREAAQAGCELFRLRRVEKSYQVLVRGWVDREMAEESPVLLEEKGEGDCRTVFTPLERYLVPVAVGKYPAMRITRLGVAMEGGRRHQIRIHASRLGHPVLGDTGHGCRHHNHVLWELWPHSRLQLACTRLGFMQPFTRETIMVNDDPRLHTGWLEEDLKGYRIP